MRKLLTASALMLFAGASHAAYDPNSPAVMSNFSYDYIEARIGLGPTTYGAALSKSIHPNAHVIASFDSQLEGDYDATAGLAFHAPINNWADFTGEMKLRFMEYEGGGSDTGMELDLGVRQWLGPQLEVGGKGGFLTVDDENDWVGNLYARFHSTELFSVGVEGIFNGTYDDQVMLTARFKY